MNLPSKGKKRRVPTNQTAREPRGEAGLAIVMLVSPSRFARWDAPSRFVRQGSR